MATMTIGDIKMAADKVRVLFNSDKFQDLFCNLYCRWQDEREYEDIKDYGVALTPLIEAVGGKVIKMMKRPFTLIMSMDNVSFRIFVKGQRMYFQPIKESFYGEAPPNPANN